MVYNIHSQKGAENCENNCVLYMEDYGMFFLS